MKKVNEFLTIGLLSFLLGFFNTAINGVGWVFFLVFAVFWLLTFIANLINND